MRIYSNAYELMSEMGRNLYEMGIENRPKHYQNKNIEGNDDFITKELMCEQYTLMELPDPDILFIHTKSKEWAEAEFAERVCGHGVNPGKAYLLRREMWDQFLTKNVYGLEKFDYTYPERINDTVSYNRSMMTKLEAIIRLLKDDPGTRKAIVDIYGGYRPSGAMDHDYLDGSHRIPCSMYYDFLLRENAKGETQLNLCYHQRSSDFVQHFGNDVWLAWKMMEYVAEKVGVKPGYLIHTIDSLHVYKKDWVLLKTSIAQLMQE